ILVRVVRAAKDERAGVDDGPAAAARRGVGPLRPRQVAVPGEEDHQHVVGLHPVLQSGQVVEQFRAAGPPLWPPGGPAVPAGPARGTRWSGWAGRRASWVALERSLTPLRLPTATAATWLRV